MFERNEEKMTETLKQPYEEGPLKDWKPTKKNHDIERADGNNGGISSLTLTSNNLKQLRNAAPHLNLKNWIDMNDFLDGNSWRFAGIEAIGTMLLTFGTAW